MILTAEFVSKGHPDRLCDAIVNEIVNYVVLKDKDALCGLECAVHTNKVFVDGRIAAEKSIAMPDMVKAATETHRGTRFRKTLRLF